MAEVVRRASGYDPRSVGVGIVHIGLGAFHRAHQAAYVERWLDSHGGGDWGICAANIRSNGTLVEQLRARGCRYQIAEYANRELVTVSEINSIRHALFAAGDPTELLDWMAAPGTRIVSLTVTEKGYHLNPASAELLLGDAGIAHDIANPRTPRTAPGLIVEALRRRRDAGLAPFTVLSCDNMPDNGGRAGRAVVALAAAQADDSADWIEAEVSFPSSMVDRIVPAVSHATAARLEAIIGYPDPAAVACEAFSQWVVEDRFPAGRPDWETVGVEMVADAGPFETAKLRLLNGAHSVLAYRGLLSGRTTVAEAINDSALLDPVNAYLDEAGASLDGDAAFDLDKYRGELLSRLRNDALEHSLDQIAMDGSQKIPQRWLDGAIANLAAGRRARATAGAVAAWMRYVRGGDRDGNSWRVDDPLATRLAACHRERATAGDIVDALLGIRQIFPEALRADRRFRDDVLAAYRELIVDR